MLIEHGYAKKILRIDLSSGKIDYLQTEYYANKYLGGRGIAASIYWDEVSPDIKAFDAENRLIFITGPLAGFPGLAGSRLQICGKSPAITPELFCYANLGGRMGAELKFAGYDGIIIQGKSHKPIYIFIQDGLIEIKDASLLWGKNSVETCEIIKTELGTSVHVLATGIAGENLVSFATVYTDDGSCGSSGFGAVMGSKQLKAIAVKGSGKVVAGNLEKYRDVTEYTRTLSRHRTITPPSFHEPEKRRACYGCIEGCLRTVLKASNGDSGKSMCQAGGFYIGPSMNYYKHLTEVPFLVNRLCDKYGLDTMVVEPIAIWITKCAQAGILTDENTDIPISKFGSLEFMESLIKKIALREGFGDLLAHGIARTADYLGKDTKALVGDLVFPRSGEIYVYDPRLYITTGLFYATEAKRPIQHLHEIAMFLFHWVNWQNGVKNAYVNTDVVLAVAKKFWGSEIAADFSTYEGKALAAKKIQERQYVKECLILCDYSWPIAHTRYSNDHIGDPAVESQILSAVTGITISEQELYGIGERVFNLQRAILAREGMAGNDLPEFNFSMPLQFASYKPECLNNPECILPGEGGKIISRKGTVLDREKFEKMRSEYYNLRGWDETGRQTTVKLQELGLQHIAQDLTARGLIEAK